MEQQPLAQATPTNHGTRGFRFRWVRAAGFAFVWWMLTGGDLRSWLVGIPVVLAAAAAAATLSPTRRVRIRPLALGEFVVYFIWRSMVGSFDVAWRALHPRLPISPAVWEYRLRLPEEGPARVFFAGVMNLLPGTLSAELHDRSVTIHLLNGRSRAARADVSRLERRVGAVFGHDVPVERSSGGEGTTDG